jgi:mannosyltransferase
MAIRAAVASRGPVGLWLLLAFALALRVWKLTDKNLGLDESTSWHVASSPFADVLAWTADDNHPPLYFLLLKVWLWIFGDSLAALRSLSVISSVIALYLLYRLVEGAMPRSVGYVVMLWCALSPLSLYQAQEARMYAPATVAVLGACLAYRRWIESGATRRSMLLLYAISAVAGLYLHHYSALVLVAIWLHFMTVGARTAAPGRTFAAWKAWLVAHAAMSVVYAPWIAVTVTQVSRMPEWRPVTLGEIPTFAVLLIEGLTFGFYPMPDLLSWASLLGIGVLALGAGCLLVSIVRTRDEQDVFFACVAYLPGLLALSLLPLTGGAPELWWYLPYSSLLIVPAAARGLTRASLPLRAVVGVICAGTLSVLPSVTTYYSMSEKDSDMRPIVAYLLTHARHGADAQSDPVHLLPMYIEYKLSYYSHDAISYLWVAQDDLGMLARDPSSKDKTVWLVVDMHSRSPTIAEVSQDPTLQPVDVPGSNPKRVRLFKLAPR